MGVVTNFWIPIQKLRFNGDGGESRGCAVGQFRASWSSSPN